MQSDAAQMILSLWGGKSETLVEVQSQAAALLMDQPGPLCMLSQCTCPRGFWAAGVGDVRRGRRSPMLYLHPAQMDMMNVQEVDENSLYLRNPPRTEGSAFRSRRGGL